MKVTSVLEKIMYEVVDILARSTNIDEKRAPLKGTWRWSAYSDMIKLLICRWSMMRLHPVKQPNHLVAVAPYGRNPVSVYLFQHKKKKHDVVVVEWSLMQWS